MRLGSTKVVREFRDVVSTVVHSHKLISLAFDLDDLGNNTHEYFAGNGLLDW